MSSEPPSPSKSHPKVPTPLNSPHPTTSSSSPAPSPPPSPPPAINWEPSNDPPPLRDRNSSAADRSPGPDQLRLAHAKDGSLEPIRVHRHSPASAPRSRTQRASHSLCRARQ